MLNVTSFDSLLDGRESWPYLIRPRPEGCSGGQCRETIESRSRPPAHTADSRGGVRMSLLPRPQLLSFDEEEQWDA
jgi:hypothetical protein